MTPTAAAAAHLNNAPASEVNVSWFDYLRVGLLLTAFISLLVYLSQLADAPTPAPELVLGPIIALVALIAVVWLAMVVVRNAAVMRGISSPAYYLAYNSHEPPDWIERPARNFNNLLQLPTLFYVVCTLMLVTHHLDRAQLAYAWVFVAARVVHTVVHVVWNPLPYRFATWVMGALTLFVIWTRFALQAWPGLS